MWETSGIDELHFAPLVHKARTIGHKQPFTGYEEQDTDGRGMHRVDRMPYFFAVLQDFVSEHNGAPHVDHSPHPITEERVEELRQYYERR